MMIALLNNENPAAGACSYVFLVLFLLGALKCFLISRRPTTSARCTIGLGLVLTGCFCFIAGPVLNSWYEHAVLSVFGIGLGFLFAVIGGVLAAIGLLEYPKVQPSFNQGRAQGMTALMVAVLMMAMPVYGVFKAMGRTAQASAKPRSFEPLNFAFDPPNGWFNFEPKILNPDAALVLRQPKSGLIFLIIAEAGVFSVGMNTAMLEEVAKAYLRGIDEHVRVSDLETPRSGAMSFETFSADATIQGQRFCYQHSVCCRNGFAYQLITYGMEGSRAKVNAAAAEMVACFRQIDPDRVDLGEGGSFVGRYESNRYGFRLDLDGRGWFTNPSLAAANEDANFVASLSGFAWLQVTPIFLGKLDPPLEASIQSMLKLRNYDYPTIPIRDRRRITSDADRELEFSYSRSVDGIGIVATCRLVQQNGVIYYIEGGRIDAYEAKQPEIEAAIRAVSFVSPPEPPDFHSMTPAEKDCHARFLNEVGNHLYANEALENAKEFYKAASDLTPGDTTIIDNLKTCLVGLNRHKEALFFLNRVLQSISGHDGLRADRAWLLALAGQDFEAMKVYERLFAGRFRDRDHLLQYTDLLEKHQRVDDALDLIAEFRKKDDGPRLEARMAMLLVTAKRHGEAIRLIEARPSPRHPELSLALVAAYEAASKPAAAWKVASDMVKGGYGSSMSYYIKARLERELGRLDAAARTVDDGLFRYVNDLMLLVLKAAIEEDLAKRKQSREKKRGPGK